MGLGQSVGPGRSAICLARRNLNRIAPRRILYHTCQGCGTLEDSHLRCFGKGQETAGIIFSGGSSAMAWRLIEGYHNLDRITGRSLPPLRGVLQR